MMLSPKDLTLNQKAVLLTLSRLPREFATDRVYFEKILFLLTKTQPDLLFDLDATFEAYKIGPYNEYVDEILGDLHNYSLAEGMAITPTGRQVAQTLSADPELAEVPASLESILDAVQELNLDVNDLLYTVYNLYPEYTGLSEHRAEARSSKLQHFTIPLPEGERPVTIFSDKGGKVNVRKAGDRVVLEPTP